MRGHLFQWLAPLLFISGLVSTRADMECAGGPEAVCKCLLGCDVFGGSGTQCLKTDNHLVLVDQAVREAMKEDGSNCDGMKCVVACAKKLGCLDPNVESRCLTVRHANEQCDVKCNHAWRKAAPTFAWLVPLLVFPLM
eukprot:Skav220011  [mRNA]  locus=scaffold947:276850:280910:+ [translate_table: standard]